MAYFVIHVVKCIYFKLVRQFNGYPVYAVHMSFDNTDPASKGFYFDKSSTTMKMWARRTSEYQNEFGVVCLGNDGPDIHLPFLPKIGRASLDSYEIKCVQHEVNNVKSWRIRYFLEDCAIKVNIASEFDTLLPFLFDKTTGYLSIHNMGNCSFNKIDFMDIIRHPFHKQFPPFYTEHLKLYELVVDDVRYPFFIRNSMFETNKVLVYMDRNTKKLVWEGDCHVLTYYKEEIQTIFDKYAVPLLKDECLYCWDNIDNEYMECTKCGCRFCFTCYLDTGSDKIKCSHCNDITELECISLD